MITSFEVGTIFKIVDRATPTVRALTRNMTKLAETSAATKKSLQGIGTLTLATIRKNMGLLTDQSIRLEGVYGSTFKTLEAGTDASIQRTKALAAEWTAVAAAVKKTSLEITNANRRNLLLPGTPGSPASPRAPSGGGRSALGIHASNGVNLPGGMHIGARGRGNAAMAGAGLLAYSVYEESQIEDIAARAIMTGQITVDKNMRSSDSFKRIRDVIQKNAAKTGFSPKEVGEAILMTERQFGGLDFNKRIDLENRILPYAALEARLKESPLPETFKAMAGLPHMFGKYKPKEQEELMRQFSFASLMTPVPIPQFERALSYSAPILHQGMGMDPSVTMFLTAMTESAGITSTKSGTWIRSFFEKLMPQSGINAMRSAPIHNAMLGQLGLVDKNLQPTWQVKGSDGKVDWSESVVKVATMLSAELAKIPDNKRMGYLTGVFGERGGGFGALMNAPEFVEQFPILLKKMKEWKGGEKGIMELLEGSPVQQARQAWSNMQIVLMDIGSIVLPPLVIALQGFDKVLKDIQGPLAWINSHVLGNSPKNGGSEPPSRINGFLGAVGEGMLTGGLLGGAVSIGSGPGVVPGIGAGAVAGGFYGGGQYLIREYMVKPNELLKGIPGDGSLHNVPSTFRNTIGTRETGTFRKTGSNQETDALDKNRLAVIELTDTIKKAALYRSGAKIVPARFTTSGDSILGASNSWSDIGQGVLGGDGGGAIGGGSSGGSAVIGSGIARSIRKGNAGGDGGVSFGGGGSGTARGSVNVGKNKVAGIIASVFRQGGMSEAGIAGILGNAQHESGMNPNNRHADQPKWGGEAHFAHGLFQMGGAEWNKYDAWLKKSHPGGDWKNPTFQNEFMVENLKKNYPKVWSGLLHARSPEEAAGIFERGYEKPNARYAASAARAKHARKFFKEMPKEDTAESPAIIPPAKNKDIHVHHTSMLDGRVVAKSTMKHMVAMGNGPARGPRIADYTATRPISV